MKKTVNHPYKNLPNQHFWRPSMHHTAVSQVDPVCNSSLTIEKHHKITTAGSCFAQHISKALQKNGYRFYIPEKAPQQLTSDERTAAQYGIYSCRFGNIYSSRQLLQLYQRAFDEVHFTDDIWQDDTKAYFDAFRPTVEPDGFSTIADLKEDRNDHLSAVRDMFTKADIFIFTLGLTEIWENKDDGAVYPLAPGVHAGAFKDAKYQFKNLTAKDVFSDLDTFANKLKSINPECQIILTVSPVPLIATYTKKHVLQATTYSKSVLRVAAEEITEKHEHIHYFPSYEIITGPYNKGMYYEGDNRGIKDFGVAHVMRIFKRNYLENSTFNFESPVKKNIKKVILDQEPVICDEELIEASL